MVTEILIEQIIAKGERLSENVYQKTKSYLPFIARCCLLSHFVHDNAVIVSFSAEIFQLIKNMEEVIPVSIVLVCFISRAAGCVLILLQKKVTLACVLLCIASILQMFIMYIPDTYTVLAKGAILGAVVILLAENKGEARSLFAGVPSLDKNHKDYMKLSGRCLLMLMFFNLISLEPSFLLILKDIFGFSLMVLVVLGYKTKLSVLATIVYLTFFNFSENNWWSIPAEERIYRTDVQNKFYEGVTVTGGLIMLVLYGPGAMSMDKAKKIW